MVKEVREEDQEYIQFQLKQTQQAVEKLEVVLPDIPRDWKDQNTGQSLELIHPKSIQVTLLEMLLSWVLPFQLAPWHLRWIPITQVHHPSSIQPTAFSNLLASYQTENWWCPAQRPNGSTSGVTVGRLNGIRSVTRPHPKDHPNQISKEVAVLFRNFALGPFSEPGDSGSAIVDGKGRLVGFDNQWYWCCWSIWLHIFDFCWFFAPAHTEAWFSC